MNILKGKKVILIVFLISGISGTAMASGDVDIDLRCNSPSASIKNTIGNNSYDGVAKRYPWSASSYFSNYDSDGNYNQIYRLTEDGYVDVTYRDVKPYVLRDDVFKANPNYHCQQVKETRPKSAPQITQITRIFVQNPFFNL
jgi:hypothetical protein